MSKRLVASSISSVALGSLAVVLLYGAGPAYAAAADCLRTARACESRCAQNYDNWPACVYRTCNTQYDLCMENLGLDPRQPPPGPIVRDHRGTTRPRR